MKFVFVILSLALLSFVQAENMNNELVLNEERVIPFGGPLQEMIDQAEEGSMIIPPAGEYKGPIVISKSIVIDGQNNVTINGEGQRHGLVIYGNNVTVKNLKITNTGTSTEREDSCVLIVQGNQNKIIDNDLTECFFGVDLKKSDENIIQNNKVSGKDISLGIRGDGIRLWYSMKNVVTKNKVSKFKDIVVWYSNDNEISFNEVSECRYSIHFMFSQYNLVDSNRFVGNAVGAYVMYTQGVVIKNNYIASSNGPTGMAVGFKEASNVYVENNDILYCAIGLGVDLSPFEPESKVVIKGNRISYNSVGIQFNSKLSGIDVVDNIFEGNIDHLSVAMNESASENMFDRNYWDTYEGFDRNLDGIGDLSYEMYSFVDKIWMEIPIARFYKNSPLMEFIDFLEQLAPISAPTLIMKDSHPVMDKILLMRQRQLSKAGGSNG